MRPPPVVSARRSSARAAWHAVLLTAAIGLLLSACGDDDPGPVIIDPGPEPAAIAAVSGGGQTAQVGTALPDPFVVEVTDDNGDPAPGVDVVWVVTGGSGTLSAAATITNASGRASSTLTLGSTAGANAATASATGLTGSPVTFSATGAAPPPPSPPTTLETVSGDGQNGKTGETLPDPFVVRVLDDQGTPVAGVVVNWAVAAGSGVMLSTSSTTNAAGEASSSFRPGNSLGSATIEASVDGLTGSPRTFTVETTVWLVRIRNLTFVDWNNSNNHTIAVGDTIEWVNLDNRLQHTATSSSNPAGGSAFRSPTLNSGDRFRFVPDAAGTWDYFCEIHGARVMSGTLTAQ